MSPRRMQLARRIQLARRMQLVRRMQRPRRPAAPPRAPRRGDAGFTLIEIVLIIVIAAVAILPLSMLFANTSIRSGDARNATIAAQLAQAKMEDLTADKNSPARGFAYLVAGNYPAESPVTAFTGYNRTVSFAPDSTYDGVTFRTVTVTVSCTNIPNVTMTTWFTSY